MPHIDISVITNLLITYRYAILFPIAAFEGPLISLVVGFLVHAGYFSVLPAFVILVLGDVIPDSMYYYAGRFGNKTNLLERYGSKYEWIAYHTDVVSRLWHRHGWKTMFLSKLAWGLSGLFLASAGLVKLPFKQFLRYALPVTLLQFGIIMAIGYELGDSYAKASSYIEYAGFVVAGVVAVLIGAYITLQRYAKKELETLEESHVAPHASRPEIPHASSFPEERIPTPHGIIWYTRTRAFPGRPYVMFLHGLSANHTTWLRALEEANARQLNAIAVDIRGHGHSDKTRNRALYTFDTFVDDIHAIITHEHIEKVIFVGYSFGGSIALSYAVRYPENVQGLILISTNYESPMTYKHIGILRPLVCGTLDLLGYLFYWHRRNTYVYYRYSENERTGYWYSVWLGLQTMPLSVNLWMLSRMIRLSVPRDALRRLSIPSFLIYAPGDPFLTRRETDDLASLLNAPVIAADHTTHYLASRAQREMLRHIFSSIDILCASAS